MAVWSSLRSVLGLTTKVRSPLGAKNAVRTISLSAINRSGGHGVFRIKPSSWSHDKFKDLLHYYFCIGLFPTVTVIFLANVFVGPAQLAPIPEDYTPKYWEYYRHPITRFLARYVMNSPQQEYEKYCHFLYEEDERIKLRKLEKAIKKRMENEVDYKAYYYKSVTGKYIRSAKDVADRTAEALGDN